MSNLYTVLLEYDGGTYCSQIRENNEKSAYLKWVERLREEPETRHIGQKMETHEDDDLVGLTGLKNVWCLPLWFGEDHADSISCLANMILTAER